MSAAPEPIHPETVLTIAAIAAVIIAALVLTVWLNRRHQKILSRFALSRGWKHYRNVRFLYRAEVGRLFPNREFDLWYIMEVESGARKVLLFEGTSKAAGTRRNVTPASVCMVESARLPSADPAVHVAKRSWLDSALPGKVETGDPEFDGKFTVRCPDEESAARALTGAIRRALLEHLANPRPNPVEISIGMGRAALLTGRIANSQNWRWEDMANLARRIDSGT
jgi:hypothetical protein